MTALKCFSKLVKVVRSVFKLVGFKLHALLVQPKHIITNYKVDSRWSLINHYYCWCTFRLPKTQWGCSGFQVTGIIEGFFGFELLIPVFFFVGGGGGGGIFKYFLEWLDLSLQGFFWVFKTIWRFMVVPHEWLRKFCMGFFGVLFFAPLWPSPSLEIWSTFQCPKITGYAHLYIRHLPK